MKKCESLCNIVAVGHHPETFSAHSGMLPLVQTLSAGYIPYSISWEQLQKRSWTFGYLLRRWGQYYYGSEWNALVPWVDEYRFLCRLKCVSPSVLHFLWAEFASPRKDQKFRKKSGVLVGTFHCSARRQVQVLGHFRCFHVYDLVTVVSATQVDFLVSRGVPSDRIRVVPHGVDTSYFRPGDRTQQEDGKLRFLLVGRTERDHAFASKLMQALKNKPVILNVVSAPDYSHFYQGLDNVILSPFLRDEELLRCYQTADLMVMPMLDCTFNNAVMESMACGTPVMTNRVGGVPEYVDETCNYVFDNKNLDEWVDVIHSIQSNPATLFARRPLVRQAAEKFDWGRIAPVYRQVYNDCMA
ncbi:MAG: glycosyltransferase [Verrucomicrobiae bacterium]|nr:glycosyltransferase [Verrucomicrobiae bacterium]